MITVDGTLRATFERFFGASSDQVDSILQHLKAVEVEGGEWLFRQGDEGGTLFFLVRGRLEVWVTPEGSDAAPTLLGEIVPGRSVGEISLLTGARRSASVRAIRHSELYSVDRNELEALARIHPAVVMELAGRVAAVLRDRTSRATPATRAFRTISIVPLGEGARFDAFRRQLEADLGRFGTTLSLSTGTLGDPGGQVPPLGAGGTVPAALRAWLHDQETLHRFLIYQCRPEATPWSIYAMQQSDLVVLVADAAAGSARGEGEAALDDDSASSNARRMLVLLQPGSSTLIDGTAAWLASRRIDFHLHVRADRDDEIARVARVISGNALGLVLAAGAARGFAHLGVYKAMCEAGVHPDWIGGTSMGAVMGACIAKGWGPDLIIERVRAAFGSNNPFGDYTLPLFSLLSGRRLERMLAKYLPGRIEDMPLPFYAVSCNLDDGAANLHESGSLADALRASVSMPGVMPPAVVDGQLTLDGAVINNMPVDVMQAKPVGRIVAVDLSSQKRYRVPYRHMPSAWAVLRGRLFPFARKYRVPSLMTLMLKATELGTMARVRELGRRADLLLTPPVREFGMMDLKSYDRIVDAGYQYARTEIAEWLSRQRQGKQVEK